MTNIKLNTKNQTGIASESYQPIKDFVENIEVHFGKKKRDDLLSVAREIMMSDDHNTVQVTNSTERGLVLGISFFQEEKTLSMNPSSQQEGLIYRAKKLTLGRRTSKQRWEKRTRKQKKD